MPAARTLHGARLEVAHGAAATLGERLRTTWPDRRVGVIIDATVDAAHGAALRRQLPADAVWLPFPAGEASKTRTTWAALTDALHAAGLGRDTVLVGIGGGVATDLAGFVAATFGRGVPAVLVPTSLLAMIDAAIGGKTGVDTPHGKNLVGVLHHPALVLIDPAFLDTLPPVERRHGAAEALKHGVIADAAYFAWAEESLPTAVTRTPMPAAVTEPLVRRSVELKAAIVAADATDAGPRRALNFGHTIGHALEQVSGYAIPHGAAVAAGMVTEARLGERIGVTAPGTADRIAAACRALELPTAIPAGIAPTRLVEATHADKKAHGGEVRYALPEAIGRMAAADAGFLIPIPDAEVVRALTEM